MTSNKFEIDASGWLIYLNVWWCKDLQTLNLRRHLVKFGTGKIYENLTNHLNFSLHEIIIMAG